MLRQKEWKSLQNISLLDKRIPCQMSKWLLIQALSTPADSTVDIFGTRWISRRVLWDRSQWLTSWARPQSQHSTRSLVTGHCMFAALCRSQLLQMHFLWLVAVVVRGLKLKFKRCVRVSPVSVWASRAMGTKPKLYPGHSPARLHTAVSTAITWSVMGISK